MRDCLPTKADRVAFSFELEALRLGARLRDHTYTKQPDLKPPSLPAGKRTPLAAQVARLRKRDWLSARSGQTWVGSDDDLDREYTRVRAHLTFARLHSSAHAHARAARYAIVGPSTTAANEVSSDGAHVQV